MKQAQGQTDMGNEIFAIGFGTRIMETELNKQKQVVQIGNTSLLLELLCYIITGVNVIIIIITINPLQTKRRPLYLCPQSVPRCKHFSSRL